MKRALKWGGIWLGVALAILAFFEAVTVLPHYRDERAVVLEVTEDRVGYIGYEDNTWVRFADGYSCGLPGRLGKPGDVILAQRRDGVSTLFGIIGDHRQIGGGR